MVKRMENKLIKTESDSDGIRFFFSEAFSRFKDGLKSDNWWFSWDEMANLILNSVYKPSTEYICKIQHIGLEFQPNGVEYLALKSLILDPHNRKFVGFHELLPIIFDLQRDQSYEIIIREKSC